MTIAEARGKCKSVLAKIPRDALIIGILVAASTASFALGFLTGHDAGGTAVASVEPGPAAAAAAAGSFVASMSGTKYYPADCAGASRISPANKISFASADAAEAAGYSRAANCK